MKPDHSRLLNSKEIVKSGQRDTRSRSEVLSGQNWTKLLSLPAVKTLQTKNLRQVDSFFDYCTHRGLTDIEVDHFLILTSRAVQPVCVVLETLYGPYMACIILFLM